MKKTENNTITNSYRKPAKYLGGRKDDVKDSLQWKQNKALPVIKNGNNTALAPTTIDGKSVTLRNTCAFDSLLYMLMLAASDFSSVKDKVRLSIPES